MSKQNTPIEEFLELTKDIKKMPPTIKMRSIATRLLATEKEKIIAQQKEIEQLKEANKILKERYELSCVNNVEMISDVEKMLELHDNDISRLLKKRQKTIHLNLELASENTKLKEALKLI